MERCAGAIGCCAKAAAARSAKRATRDGRERAAAAVEKGTRGWPWVSERGGYASHFSAGSPVLVLWEANGDVPNAERCLLLKNSAPKDQVIQV